MDSVDNGTAGGIWHRPLTWSLLLSHLFQSSGFIRYIQYAGESKLKDPEKNPFWNKIGK